MIIQIDLKPIDYCIYSSFSYLHTNSSILQRKHNYDWISSKNCLSYVICVAVDAWNTILFFWNDGYFLKLFIFPPEFDFTWFFCISGRSELNNILKEREERVKRVRQEQEAERLKKADEWKQQVSIGLGYINDHLA